MSHFDRWESLMSTSEITQLRQRIDAEPADVPLLAEGLLYRHHRAFFVCVVSYSTRKRYHGILYSEKRIEIRTIREQSRRG